MKPPKQLELPPAVAGAFVKDMKAFDPQDVCERVKSPHKRAAAPTTLTSWSPRRPVRESWHKIDFASHIDRMAEISRHHLEVIVVARDDSWEWQVQSQGTVLVTGTGRTRLLARFLGNDARLRLLAEGFGNP